MKGNREIRGVVSTLTRNEGPIIGASQALPKKCRDPGIFSIPCTISECTFVDAMLDLGALINVMPASIYRALNFCDLEPTRMTIQLANRNIVQPLGVLEDVHVQVNKQIFPANFYVLDMEDKTFGKESTLILGRPFLMTTRTKIDHLTKDHSLFGSHMIEELVEEYFQLDGYSEDRENFAGNVNVTSCLWSITEELDYEEIHNLPNSEDNNDDVVDLDFKDELFEVIDQVCNHEKLEYVNNVEVKVAETNKPSSAQHATIFTTKGESTTEGQNRKMTKVNSAKEN
ncbi:hypothetical protein CR513_10772, partial [Mucuna pruriens]